MIKTVAFDLGNVLVFFSFPKMLRQMADCTGLDEHEVDREFVEGPLRMHYETGKLSTQGLKDAFQQKATKPFTEERFRDALCDIFVLNNEIVPVVESLKRQGIRLVLLSNTSEAHFTYLWKTAPVLQLFDAKILSYEVGVAKPAPAIYHAAIEAAECDPRECFYTDDIPAYVEGARREGLDAEVFVGVNELRRQLAQRGIVVD